MKAQAQREKEELSLQDKVLDSCNVFVKYLPSQIDDKMFHKLFKVHGNIVSCKIMMDQATGSSLGYGTSEAAQACIQAMNGLRLYNKRLLCKLANQSTTSTFTKEYARNPLLVSQFQSDNLYIKPLLPTTTEVDLRELFGSFGTIKECKVMMDRSTGLSRQIGFVRFESAEVAQQVVNEMNGHRLHPQGPPLTIKFADTKEQKDARYHLRQTLHTGMTILPQTHSSSLPIIYAPMSPSATSSDEASDESFMSSEEEATSSPVAPLSSPLAYIPHLSTPYYFYYPYGGNFYSMYPYASSPEARTLSPDSIPAAMPISLQTTLTLPPTVTMPSTVPLAMQHAPIHSQQSYA